MVKFLLRKTFEQICLQNVSVPGAGGFEQTLATRALTSKLIRP